MALSGWAYKNSFKWAFVMDHEINDKSEDLQERDTCTYFCHGNKFGVIFSLSRCKNMKIFQSQKLYHFEFSF